MAKTRRRDDAPSNSSTSTLEHSEQLGNTEQNGTNERPDPERISARAYELYLARGGADGQAWDDWLAAERELSDAVVPRERRDE
jgi:hypothetical protein